MKIILVTRSMEGLVVCVLTQLHGYERVLGIVYDVQPVTGPSTVYHHMRCSCGGIAQVVLGRDADEVTAVVTDSTGALELAPSTECREGRPRPSLYNAQGQVLEDIDGKPRTYSQNQDPYEEIYKSSTWYGLVPGQNAQYLDLSNTEDKKKNPRVISKKKIDATIDFHNELATAGYRIETYVRYSANDSCHSWRNLVWKDDPTPLETPGAIFNDNRNGTYNSWFRRGLPTIVQGPLEVGNPLDASGDGGDETVPTGSGQMPALAGIKAGFRHGNKGKGQANIKRGHEHQESYSDTHT